LSGETVDLSALRGKRVLLHFWATWCGVCRREFSALESLQGGLDEDEVLLTVVADGEDTERLRAFVAEHGITYPVLLGNDDLVHAFGVGAFPTNFFIDASGHVAGSTVGMSTRWAMGARLGCAR